MQIPKRLRLSKEEKALLQRISDEFGERLTADDVCVLLDQHCAEGMACYFDAATDTVKSLRNKMEVASRLNYASSQCERRQKEEEQRYSEKEVREAVALTLKGFLNGCVPAKNLTDTAEQILKLQRPVKLFDTAKEAVSPKMFVSLPFRTERRLLPASRCRLASSSASEQRESDKDSVQ